MSEDPFTKVKKMIKDMVVKLMEEANDEAEHKGWCDTELGTNKQTRDEKSALAAELTASIEQMNAQTQQVSSEIADLAAEVSALDEAVATATADRQAEKEKNTETISDSKAAIIAVESAMTVLKEFYDKAATATALVQTKLRGKTAQMPETFDKPFTGMGGNGGIMGMLEVILSDFNRLLTETTEAEFMSDKDTEKFLAQSSEDKAVKLAESRHKQNKKVSLESDTQTAKSDLKNTDEELDAAMSYYEKLKPSCIDAGENYEERVARRKEEIESLGEALKILAGEEI
jgi:septal ring factor EnvC (AmiA/AmiB activator)